VSVLDGRRAAEVKRDDVVHAGCPRRPARGHGAGHRHRDVVLTVAEFIGEPSVVTVTCAATGGGDPGAIVQNAKLVAQHVGRVVSPVF
jgi:hypothetical protein